MAGRGILTKALQKQAKKLLGQEISQKELRLMPYIQYLAVNSGKVDPTRVTPEERAILSRWRNDGLITGGASEPVWISLEFWKAINELIWLAYVDNENQESP